MIEKKKKQQLENASLFYKENYVMVQRKENENIKIMLVQ